MDMATLESKKEIDKAAAAGDWDSIAYSAFAAKDLEVAKYAMDRMADAGKWVHLSIPLRNMIRKETVEYAREKFAKVTKADVEKAVRAGDWASISILAQLKQNRDASEYAISCLSRATKADVDSALSRRSWKDVIALSQPKSAVASYAEEKLAGVTTEDVDRIAQAKDFDGLWAAGSRAKRPEVAKHAIDKCIEAGERGSAALCTIVGLTKDQNVARYGIDNLAGLHDFDTLYGILYAKSAAPETKDYVVRKFEAATVLDVDSTARKEQWSSVEEIGCRTGYAEVGKHAIDRFEAAKRWTNIVAIGLKTESPEIAKAAVDTLERSGQPGLAQVILKKGKVYTQLSKPHGAAPYPS